MNFLKLTDSNDNQKYINMDLVCEVKTDDKGSLIFYIASCGKDGNTSLALTRVKESGQQIMSMMGQPT